MVLMFDCIGVWKKDWSLLGCWLDVWGGKNGGLIDGEWVWNLDLMKWRIINNMLRLIWYV